ncbi:MAG: serine dehydrogenasease [Rhodothermaceae bacterium]|nr:serine dehydrogenasease [Rhodothermaceae bacterium]MXW33466.1 serine dehydrogenasease [Rhodothermaceae bacterium]MYC04820.1 serine dehydrogenasease [Rhodothermaceae bacterium]MYE63953.1 serine dehydrogenasease [Rhodothermaceae bacterium]MYI16092.1 serine dehydrogenasease [Rhodothermaceae bacterium]
MEAINTDSLTNFHLHGLNVRLSEKMEGDCVFINSAMIPRLDDEFRVTLEEIKGTTDQPEQDHLIVMLQTSGGLMETVERLVAVMRTHYNQVSFVIPNFAYSAGTVLALSGNNIYMDYYSVLGPIDPQILSKDGSRWLPGLGILAKFDEICEKINQAKPGEDCRAELAYLVRQFEPEQLFAIEQAKQHGITLITEWLPKYKFKKWTKTETNRNKVTDPMRKRRAEEIAQVLGDASRWHSHGRGISMRELGENDLKLKIDDFGADEELSNTIRNYHGLAVDYYGKSGVTAYVHSKLGLRTVR